MLYFAYGSNLHKAQMARRCPDAEPVGQLVLPNTRLVFRGVADVVREDGAACPGAIWRITPRCEAALDRYEGFDPCNPERGMYSKELVPVDGLPDGETHVMLYVMNSVGIYPPSERYFATIVQGYRDFGLALAALKDALDRAHADKRPSHVERRRMRRTGRPPLAQRKRKPEPAREPAPAREHKRHDKRPRTEAPAPKRQLELWQAERDAKRAAARAADEHSRKLKGERWRDKVAADSRRNGLAAWLKAKADRGEKV